MVDGLALAADWNEVTVNVWPEHEVLGVQEEHMVCGSGSTDTTIKHNVRSHTSAVILQRSKASTGGSRTGVRNTLNGLQGLQIQLVEIAIGNNQVRLIGTTDQLNRERVHIGLNVGSVDRRTTIGNAGILNRAPEGERSAVDAAVGAAARSVRNSRSQTRDVLAAVARAVAVNVATDTVGELGFSHVHATVKQVNNGFLAAVLDHFQTGNGNSRSILSNAELSRRDWRVLRHVQHFIAGIAVGVVGRGIVVHDFLQNHVTTGERLDVTTVLKTAEQGVVVRYVVSEFTTAALDISRNDVADRGIGESHTNLSQLNQRRSFIPSNCSSSIDRLSCALVAVGTPGVELLTLTAAALAAFAARLAESLLSLSSLACWLC